MDEETGESGEALRTVGLAVTEHVSENYTTNFANFFTNAPRSIDRSREG